MEAVHHFKSGITVRQAINPTCGNCGTFTNLPPPLTHSCIDEHHYCSNCGIRLNITERIAGYEADTENDEFSAVPLNQLAAAFEQAKDQYGDGQYLRLEPTNLFDGIYEEMEVVHYGVRQETTEERDKRLIEAESTETERKALEITRKRREIAQLREKLARKESELASETPKPS